MKEGFNPREILGLTQSQIALLLKVSRSHWAMYEKGKRHLPDSASSVLHDMMANVHTVEVKATPKTERQEKQYEDMQEALQKMFKENKYQLEHVARKLAPLERKHQAHLKAQQTVAYLKAKNPEASERESKLLDLIHTMATRGITHKLLLQITKWQIKLELLQEEKKLLEERIAKGNSYDSKSTD